MYPPLLPHDVYTIVNIISAVTGLIFLVSYIFHVNFHMENGAYYRGLDITTYALIAVPIVGYAWLTISHPQLSTRALYSVSLVIWIITAYNVHRGMTRIRDTAIHTKKTAPTSSR